MFELMRYFIFIILLFHSYVNFAQVDSIDSVKQAIENSKQQKQKSILYKELALLYEKTEIDSSIYYANKGYELARSINYKVGIAENASQLGYFLVLKNDLNSSKKYYKTARQNYFETDSVFKYAQSSMRLGNINLAQSNPIDALKLYQECLNISEDKGFSSLKPHLYNNIGLVYKQIEDYEDALTNFQTAYNLFIENEDEANAVYSLYNTSLIKSILGQDKEAIDGYLDLVSYHLKTKNWLSLAQIYNSISEIHLSNKAYDQAQEYLEMALSSLKNKSDSFNTGPTSFHKASIYANASELYYEQNEIDLAKNFAHKTINLSEKNSYKSNILRATKVLAEIYDRQTQVDSSLYYHKLFIDYNTQYQDEYDVKKLTKLKMQNEFDEILKQNEIDRIYQEAEYKNREIKYIASIIVAALVAVILILFFVNIKNKNAKLKLKEENLLLEKNKLNQDLEHKKKELVSNLMYLMEKNEFITSISKKLIKLKPDAKKDNKDLIQQIINEIRHNSSNKMWEEFELRFTEVHTRFYKELLKTHSDLTPNEVKICAFLRLNMSTKEISAITHQSIKSINMARFRLRKKLQIEREENLIAYLCSL